MYKPTLVVCLLLAAAAAGAVALNEDARDPAFGLGPLSPEIIVERLGHTPDEVRVTTYTPEPQEQMVPWQEFTLMLQDLAAASAPAVPLNHPAAFDVGQGTTNAPGFCDNSSFWVFHDGQEGAAYAVSEQLGPGTSETCDGWYGPSFTWLIVMSTAGLNVGYEGCYATTWALHGDGYCPDPFTGGTTWGTAVINGNGVKTSVGIPGWGAFDYFLGNGATVAYTL